MFGPFTKNSLNYSSLLFAVALLIINSIFLQNSILGLLGLIFYLVPLSLLLGQILFGKERYENFLFGLLFIFSELIISGTLLYYFFAITPLLSWILLALPFATFLFLKLKKGTTAVPKEVQDTSSNQKTKIFSKNIFFWSLPVLVLDFILLWILFKSRTYDLAASPWQHLGPLFFLTYTFTTAFLFVHYKKFSDPISSIFLTSFHFFVGIAVAAFMYPLGYGFDAFIHRVTESWIQVHGFIAPKNPYYIGQYTLVNLISNVTQIKIFFVDVFLVPLLTSIFLPGIILSLLRQFVQKPFFSAIGFWLLPFIPFLSLHLTTPHNLVIFITLVVVFLGIRASKKDISFLLPFLLSLSAVLTHPLVGAPVFIFTFVLFLLSVLEKRKKLQLTLLLSTFIGICILIPMLFTLNGLRIGHPLPTLNNPFTKISLFFDLFERPYWYAKNSPVHFELLYTYERFLVPVFLVLCAYGFFQYRKKERSVWIWLFPLTALGLFLDAWLLRSWIVFPDVVAYEQDDYPRRLIYTSILFLLPFAMYGFGALLDKILEGSKLKNKIIMGSIMICLPLILTVSLYFSYPQKNAKVQFPGYNVTSADFEAVQWIHNQNTEYNYIVLANQLVSAAALTEYSFAKYFDTPQGQMFYYSIPTGGVLYSYYSKMIYEGQKIEYMHAAMRAAGVQKAYFVVNAYWANSDKIIKNAQKTADRMQVIDDKIWIFEYSLK